APGGWKPDQVMLLPSHSHTSFDLSALNPRNDLQILQIGLFNKGVFERLVGQVADLIQGAARAPEPAAVGTTSVLLKGWSHNRREGNSTVDPELTVTRVDRLDGRPLAILVNWPAHPTF